MTRTSTSTTRLDCRRALVPEIADGTHRVPPGSDGAPLDRVLRMLMPGVPWASIRRAIRTGKVSVDGRRVVEPRTPVDRTSTISIALSAPRPSTELLSPRALIYVDVHVVVVDKPAGKSSVPYAAGERGHTSSERDSLVDLVRQGLRRREGRPIPPLGVVHRLDKETSGLLVFARNLGAKRSLKQQFRFHRTHRRYLAIAAGTLEDRTLRSRLVADRGDGKRGSTGHPELGREAVTHVRVLEHLEGATLVECRLETGRTHQIRIHLAEAGHPILGERVYARGAPVPSTVPRLMLHARELGFTHPISGKSMHFESPLPEDFLATLAELRRY